MLLFFLALVYLFLRFFLTTWLDSIAAYSSYILEVILVTISLFIIKPKIKFKQTLTRNKCLTYLGLLISGFLVFRGAGLFSITIPFNLNETETIIFLLIVAPLLEELIFRFFLWNAFPLFGQKAILIITSLLFSYSHLHAIWYVPEQIKSFVYYQTIYTLILGFTCGYVVFKNRSLMTAIFIHFFFNLGFYLASL